MSLTETFLKDEEEVDSVGIVIGPDVQDQRGACSGVQKMNSIIHYSVLQEGKVSLAALH